MKCEQVLTKCIKYNEMVVIILVGRFGKNTHISMISNSVTHLRSYTNSAIAVNSAPISLVTPRDRQRRRAERRRLRAERRRPHRATTSPHPAPISSH